MLTDVLEAVVKIGLPVMLLAYILLRQLYQAGTLDPCDDEKTVDKQLGKLRKDKDSKVQSNLLQAKWMQFGGGFYGLAALWTFAVIEVFQFIGFVRNFPGFEALFKNGVINLAVDIFVNQIQNLVAAFVWFTYWAPHGSTIGWWILVAYVSYLLGMYLARATTRID